MTTESAATTKITGHETPLEHGELIVSEPTDEFGLPKVPTYCLNSKKLKAKQLRGITEALDLPSTASAEDTRQIIEGKLRELD